MNNKRQLSRNAFGQKGNEMIANTLELVKRYREQNNMTWGEVTVRLNAQGMRTATGKRWNKGNLISYIRYCEKKAETAAAATTASTTPTVDADLVLSVMEATLASDKTAALKIKYVNFLAQSYLSQS